jgi:acyl-CoA thioester hydrolase
LSVFTWPARVYWEDTDAGGVVYYANYYRFMERARTEWLRAHGFSQSALALDPGVLFTVVESQLKYHKPARIDDLLVTSCEPVPAGRVAVDFRQRIWRGSEAGVLLAEGHVKVVSVDAKNFRACRLPESMVSAIAAAEAN